MFILSIILLVMILVDLMGTGLMFYKVIGEYGFEAFKTVADTKEAWGTYWQIFGDLLLLIFLILYWI